MNILITDKRVAVIAKDTVLKLLRAVGEECLALQNVALRNLPCTRLECDEIWCYCYAKDKDLPAHMCGCQESAARGPGPRFAPTRSSWYRGD